MKYLLLTLIVFTLGVKTGHAQEWIADSLIQKLQSGEPGYDQVDYCLGIYRAYMIARNNEEGRRYIDKAWKLSEEYDDLAGKSQSKVFYGLIERTGGGNLAKAESLFKEAYEYGLESKDNDALIFAVYQYAEVLGNYQRKNEVALRLLEKHFDNIDRTTTNKNKANFYKSYGHALARQGNDKEAIGYYRQALGILKTMMAKPDKHYRLDRVSALYADKGITNTAVTQNDLARAYARTGNLTEAIRLSEDNLEMVTAYNVTDYMAWISYNIGNFHKEKGDFATAIQYYQDATLIWEQDPTATKDIAQMKIPMGEIYTQLKDYDKAMDNYEYAMNYALSHQDTSSYLDALILRSNCLSRQGDLSHSYDEIMKSEQIAFQFGSQEIIAEVKMEKAAISNKMGSYLQAIENLQDAYKIYEGSSNASKFPEIHNQLASNYLQLENTSSAMENLNRSIELSKINGQGNQLSKGYKLLSGVYSAQGNYKAALDNFTLFHENENNLLASNAQKILREEQVRQNVNQFKQEKEIATERASFLQTQNRLYIGLAGTLLGFLMIVGYLYKQVIKSRTIIRKSNQELADLNKTKDKFFSIIAHDIRSPLVALGGVGEQMDYYIEKGKTEKMSSLSDKISRTTNQLSSLLDNLLNWALLQRGVLPHNPETISLYELVSDNVNMYILNAETKNIQLVNRVEEDVFIEADSAAVNTIVRNLISNALKFTPEGGQVVIETELADHNVCIKVIDNGIGMNGEKAERIFDLSPNRDIGTDGEKGTGLGLLLCKELVRLNRGTIDVKTQENEGSTFSVELPKAA